MWVKPFVLSLYKHFSYYKMLDEVFEDLLIELDHLYFHYKKHFKMLDEVASMWVRP